MQNVAVRPDQMFQVIVDRLPQGIFWKDRNSTYLGCNRSFARDAGVDDPALVVGRSDFDLSWKATAHLYVATDRIVMESNEPKADIDVPITHPDGRTIWIRTSKFPLHDASGAVIGVVGTHEDVTGQRQAALDLLESEERFRATFEQAAVGIAHVGADGRFLRVNRKLCEMVGYTREELLSGRFQDITHPEELGADLENVRKMLAGEIQAYSMEKRYLRKDGGTAWIALSVSLVRDEEGQPKYFISVIEDIEPQRRAREHELELRSQLEQILKMETVGRLAGGIAHDFNNLLTAILGYAEAMEVKLSDDEDLRSSLREIRKAGERAAALTRQLLAFSRKQVLQPRLLGLNAIVTEMEKLFRRLIGEDVQLITRLDPGLASVKADAGQIEQVLMNLAVNARDAMPAGGALTIATGNTVLDAGFAAAHPGAQGGDHVVLTVSDTGTGMSADVLRHVFEPFFTTKEPGKGTGLGLATAYGIVKQSGGYITVESEPGRGTTFRIYFPRAAGVADLSQSGRRRVVSQGGAETILLVEDEPSVRRLARRILETNGYTVLDAATGDEALEAARAHSGDIHLVATDVIMPGMNGRALWDRLRQLRPTARVLFLSGYTDDVIARHGVLESDTAFLQKPFTSLELARKVREVLDDVKRQA